MRSFTTKTHIGRCIALCALFIFSMLFAACGSSSSTSDKAAPDTGSISFSVVWPGTTSQNVVLKAAKLSDDCTGFGVSWVKAQVLDGNDKIIAKGPRTSEGWPCDAGQGTITDVPVGAKRKVVVFGMDSNWNVMYKGESLRMTVRAGPNLAGAIILYPVNVWFVDGDVTSSGGGQSWTEAFRTIDEAINKAGDGHEIWVKEGVYVLSSTIQVSKPVKIYAGFAGIEIQRDQRDWQNNETTVDGAGSKCFYVTADAIIDGFTITGASGESGIYNGSCSPIITNCTLSGNGNSETLIGGGIYNSWSSSTITNCTFAGNSASEKGGGIYNESSSPNIANCIFSGNSASEKGGGIYNESSSPNIANCIFSGNSAFNGGGIYNFNSSANIINCTFSGNSGSGNGGGIYNESSSPNITNCILWGDTAGTSAPEIYDDGGSDITVTYCNIDQNGYAGSDGNICQDPLFGADLHLQVNSPCIIYTADPASAPPYDIDGEARPQGDGYDRGADEFYDSDGDEMPDYWEVKYGLDDWDADPDGDGLTNLEEYQDGTNPIDASPTANITNPLDGSSHDKDNDIVFKGTGSDPEDGVLTGNSLVWTSSINDEIGTGTDFSTSLSLGEHTITLTATDTQGATGSHEISITVDHH